MRSAANLEAVAGAVRPRRLHSVADALRGITRAQWLAAFAFGCAFNLYMTAGNLPNMLSIPYFSGRPMLLAISFGRDVLAALSLLVCVAVAERVAGQPTKQATYLAAIVVSAVIAGPIAAIPRAATYVLGVPGTAAASPQERRDDLVAAAWGRFFQWVMFGGAATFIYVDRRRALAASAKLHAAELERTRAARRTIESRLQAMQARVEPQFLFNTLAQVRDLYREDAARGERMLDELIAYLRAAMPRMRDTSSTLRQEIELARAYLAIVAVRIGDRLSVSIDAPAAGGDARIPPMLLLPLVDDAVRAASAPGPRSIAVRGAVTSGTIRLTVTAGASAFVARDDSAGIAELRERLAALFGAQARLVLDELDGGMSQAVLDLPLEHAPVAAP